MKNGLGVCVIFNALSTSSARIFNKSIGVDVQANIAGSWNVFSRKLMTFIQFVCKQQFRHPQLLGALHAPTDEADERALFNGSFDVFVIKNANQRSLFNKTIVNDMNFFN